MSRPSAASGLPRRTSRFMPCVLLASGPLSSLLYAGMLVFVPMEWKGYNSAAQAVSELSAIGAPTRSLWVSLGVPYTLLIALFGGSVMTIAGRNRALRALGIALIAHGILGLLWPPMHLRGEPTTLSDTMHIVFTIATLLLILVAIVAGASALGPRFRRYSIATIALFVVFGALAGMEGPSIAANLPTPRIGVWERINIGAWLLWVIVAGFALARRCRPGGIPVQAPGIRPIT